MHSKKPYETKSLTFQEKHFHKLQAASQLVCPMHSRGWWIPTKQCAQQVKWCTANLRKVVNRNVLKLSLIALSTMLFALIISSALLPDPASHSITNYSTHIRLTAINQTPPTVLPALLLSLWLKLRLITAQNRGELWEVQLWSQHSCASLDQPHSQPVKAIVQPIFLWTHQLLLACIPLYSPVAVSLHSFARTCRLLACIPLHPPVGC